MTHYTVTGLLRAIEENTMRQPINRVSWACNPDELLARAAELSSSAPAADYPRCPYCGCNMELYGCFCAEIRKTRQAIAAASGHTAWDADNYIAWMCWRNDGEGLAFLELCDQDDEGAFKVYRAPAQPPSAVSEALELLKLAQGICPACSGTDLHSALIEGTDGVSCFDCDWGKSYAALQAALSTP